MKIRFEKVDDVVNFVKVVSKFDCEIDLKKERYVVPANSMMGIFAIGVEDEFELIIHSENKDIINNFKEWEVE